MKFLFLLPDLMFGSTNTYNVMEEWQIDFNWLKVQHYLKDITGKKELPDLNAVLFLIGIQELGQIQSNFTKEEKQDLMHIAICRLLSDEGYFKFNGLDAQGWPHYEVTKKIDVDGLKSQESFLKSLIIKYFDTYID